MRAIRYTCVIIFCFSLYTSFAQPRLVREPKIKKNTLAVQPMYLLVPGLRIDYEMALDDKQMSWLQLSGAGYFFYGETDNYLNDYGYLTMGGDNIANMSGTGLGLQYKHFINKKKFWYYSAGTMFNYYNINYIDTYMYPYEYLGLTYYEQKFGECNQNIKALSTTVNFGMQTPLSRRVFFDAYVGLGYRHAFYGDKNHRLFDDGIIGYGYKGVSLVTGVRIGIGF